MARWNAEVRIRIGWPGGGGGSSSVVRGVEDALLSSKSASRLRIWVDFGKVNTPACSRVCLLCTFFEVPGRESQGRCLLGQCPVGVDGSPFVFAPGYS